jgi:hypothetical protein
MFTNNVSSEVSIQQQLEISRPKESSPDTYDPFDLTRLRLSQDFLGAAGVKKVLTTVPVRKPSKEWFVRVHPDTAYQLQTCVVELKEDNEVYLVDRPLWVHLVSESTFSPRALFTAINRQNVLFLWPIRLPGPDGKLDDWNRSALEAAALAQQKWVRVQANKSLGAYETFEAAAEWGDADWSSLLPLTPLLKVAFKDRFIDTLDHPVLRRLRGEA